MWCFLPNRLAGARTSPSPRALTVPTCLTTSGAFPFCPPPTPRPPPPSSVTGACPMSPPPLPFRFMAFSVFLLKTGTALLKVIGLFSTQDLPRIPPDRINEGRVTFPLKQAPAPVSIFINPRLVFYIARSVAEFPFFFFLAVLIHSCSFPSLEVLLFFS